MGLDITAYEKIELVESATLESMKKINWEHPLVDREDHIFVYADKSFAQKSPQGGFYRTSGEEKSFRAGSYSGYNWWREQLAALVGTTPEAIWRSRIAPAAFGELINFSDCEGTLKSEVCAKLAKDFADWQERAAAFKPAGDEGYWMRGYNDWREAFELASKSGCVNFH